MAQLQAIGRSAHLLMLSCIFPDFVLLGESFGVSEVGDWVSTTYKGAVQKPGRAQVLPAVLARHFRFRFRNSRH